MKIKTRCDNCGKVYNMASEYTGRTAQCKRCQHHFIMNPYEPAAEVFPGPVQTPPPPPRPSAWPPPVSDAPPAAGPRPGQHPMADQTILPNAAYAQDYALQPPPQAAYAPQPEFQARSAAFAGRTQTALCLQCGHSVEIPVPSKTMKITCPACGAKIAVVPKSGKAKGSGKSLLLLVFLLLILAGALFVAPTYWPDIFPDLIGDYLLN